MPRAKITRKILWTNEPLTGILKEDGGAQYNHLAGYCRDTEKAHYGYRCKKCSDREGCRRVEVTLRDAPLDIIPKYRRKGLTRQIELPFPKQKIKILRRKKAVQPDLPLKGK